MKQLGEEFFKWSFRLIVWPALIGLALHAASILTP